MGAPEVDARTRLCVVLAENETKFYGNAAAFRTLAAWMHWLASSPEEEHYELHMRWHLEPFDSKETGEPRRVWVFSELDPTQEGPGARNEKGYLQTEFTFMVVEDSDLDALVAATRQQATERCEKQRDE